MLKFKNFTDNSKINLFFIILTLVFLILSLSFGYFSYINNKNIKRTDQARQISADDLKSRFEKISSLSPIEGVDTGAIEMISNAVGKVDDSVKIIIINTSNPQVLNDGSIIYGSSQTSVKITISVSFAGEASPFTKDITVLIPKKKNHLAKSQKNVNVENYGAKGDGMTDDTLNIQKAIDYVNSVGGGTVSIPAGDFIINPDVSINMKSGVQLSLSGDTVLKSSASGRVNSEVINIVDVNDVSVTGGKIIGDRYIHKGTEGEWGVGINIVGSSKISVTGIHISNCWGDGIYIGDRLASDIKIDNVISDNNRRQGLSITDARNVTITNSEFTNTNGTLPQAGIDIEPNPGQSVENVKIDNVKLIGNKGSGVDILGAHSPVRGVEISNSVMIDNSGVGVMMSSASKVALNNSHISGSIFGIELRNDVNDVVFSGVKITNNLSRGVSLVSSSQATGIKNVTFKDVIISNNSQRKPGESDGVRIDTYDSTGYIKNVKFMNTKFIDDQKVHTQGFGLTVGNSKLISDIAIYNDCVFSGNISGDLYSAIPISRNVAR